MKICFLHWIVASAVVMISPIPDQIVSQGASISIAVDTYFNEAFLDYELLTSDFLGFSQRHLEAVNVLTVSSQWQSNFVSAAHSHRFVAVLQESAGVVMYEMQDQTQLNLLQHYFADGICRNYTNLTMSGDALCVYNLHELAVLDIGNKNMPWIIATAELPYTLTTVMLRGDNQLLVGTEDHGLLSYEYSEETGIAFKANVSERFRKSGSLHPIDLLELWDRLFLLDRFAGVVSVNMPWMNNAKEYGVFGEKLSQSDYNLVVDGKFVLHLSNNSVSSLLSIDMKPKHLVSYKEMVYVSNGTHLGAVNQALNLSTIEAMDIRALDLYNSNLMIVQNSSIKLRNYVPGSTTLSGVAPDVTGEYKIRFIAKAKDGQVEVSFSVIVESPPLEILLVLLGASALALLFIIGCSLLLRKVIGLTPRSTNREEFNEERRSTDQLRAESMGAGTIEISRPPPQP